MNPLYQRYWLTNGLFLECCDLLALSLPVSIKKDKVKLSMGGHHGRAVKSTDFITTHNHLIISSLCLVKAQASEGTGA